MLISLLRSGASADPSQPLVTGPDGSVSYGDALERAERIAAGLAERGIDRFGIASRRPSDVIQLLCASSAIGAEA